tara:strand:+ start:1816 stop:3726 length:1911 start_codon:yes stop_codon:yes gene_type:complete
MAQLDFRILIDTEDGKKYSYSTGSLVNTDTTYVLQTSEIVDRINSMPSGSYINAVGQTLSSASMAAHSGSTPRKFSEGISTPGGDRQFLSMSMNDGPNSGSIIFNSETVQGDYVKRFKFFGNKVCNVLGLPENFWLYSDHFRLTNTSSEANFIQGNTYASSMNVRDNIAIANSGQISSDLPFKINKETDRWIKFTERAGNVLPTHKFLLGYSLTNDRYELRVGDSGNDAFYFTGSNDATIESHIKQNIHETMSFSDNTKLQFGTGDTYIMSDSQTHENLEIAADDDIRMWPDGNVGINSANPPQTLTVGGRISCSSHMNVGNGGYLSGIGFGGNTNVSNNTAFVGTNDQYYATDGFTDGLKHVLLLKARDKMVFDIGCNTPTMANNGLTWDFTINGGSSPAFRISGSEGHTSIGSTAPKAPKAQLHVDEPNTRAPSLSFGDYAGQIFQNENSEFAFGLSNVSPWSLWMQGRHSSDGGGPRAVSLNPLGGEVIVGSITGSGKSLTVAGEISSSGAISIKKISNSAYAKDAGIKWMVFTGTTGNVNTNTEITHGITNGTKRIVSISTNIQCDDDGPSTIPTQAFIAGGGNFQDETTTSREFQTWYDDDKIYIHIDSAGSSVDNNQFTMMVHYTNADLY